MGIRSDKLLVLIACASCQVPERATPPAAASADAPFPEQPECRRLVRWGADIVALTDPPVVIDVAAGRAVPLDMPEHVEVLALAASDARRFMLVSTSDGRFSVLEREAGAWRHLGPSALVSADVLPDAIAAAEDLLVVVEGTSLHRYRAGWWDSTPILGLERLPSGTSHTLLLGRRLLIGFDAGEWGGTLLWIDVETGEWSSADPAAGWWEGLPVRAITQDLRGRVWVVRGLAHLNGLEGWLLRWDGAAWAATCGNKGDNHHGAADVSEGGGEWRIGELSPPSLRTEDWSLAADAFDGVGFDDQGAACLLTTRQGVVRQAPDGAWRQVSRTPPEGQCTGFVIDGRSAVIGTGVAGVILVGLDDGHVRRIDLRSACATHSTPRVRRVGDAARRHRTAIPGRDPPARACAGATDRTARAARPTS